MSESPKRKINANQVATDIKMGVSDTQLMLKYGLSEHQLWGVKTKLARLNLVPPAKARPPRHLAPAKPDSVTPATTVTRKAPAPPSGLREVTPPTSQRVEPPAWTPQREWVCPSCGNRQPREYRECPVCGIVVSKYRSAYQQGPYVVSRSYSPEKDQGSDTSMGWKAVAISIAIMVVLGVGLVKWASHRGSSRGVSGSDPHETGFVKAFTKNSFEDDVLAASRRYPVLVEFYADT